MKNTNLTIRTLAQIEELRFSELSDVYNEFAAQVGLKAIKKFRDKATGIQRVVDIQETYCDDRKAFLKTTEEKAEKSPARKTKLQGTDIIGFSDDWEPRVGTIGHCIKETIIRNEDGESDEWSVTVEDLIFEATRTYRKPRSNVPVDEAFIRSAINWFVNQGDLIVNPE